MLQLAFLSLVLGVVAFFGWRFAQTFRAAVGSPWERALAAAKDSATVLWQYVVAFAGVAIAWAAQAADYLNLPEVRGFIQQNLQPEYVGAAFMAIAVVSIVARLRTLRAS